MRLAGIQLGSYSVYDEGVERCLDHIAQAGVNTLLPYAVGGGRMGLPSAVLAPDHGVMPGETPVTDVWVRFDPALFRGLALPCPQPGPGQYQGEDVLETLAEPARRRGMRLHPRILAHYPKDPAFSQVRAHAADGSPLPAKCWRHPELQAWWAAVVESLFRGYDLHGFHFGDERAGPLSEILVWGRRGGCFCEHCQAEGRRRGIDLERARTGFLALEAFAKSMRSQTGPASDGVGLSLLRLFMKHPEVLSWDRMWIEGRFALERRIAETARAIRPEAEIGWHIWQYATTFDPLAKAAQDYGSMTAYSSYLKPVVYHDIAGPRLRGMLTEGFLNQGLYRDLGPDLGLEFHRCLLGWEPVPAWRNWSGPASARPTLRGKWAAASGKSAPPAPPAGSMPASGSTSPSATPTSPAIPKHFRKPSAPPWEPEPMASSCAGNTTKCASPT